MDERDLHIKVISYIRNHHPNAILFAGLGKLQDSSTKRIEAYKKGYMKGQFDITILNNHKRIQLSCSWIEISNWTRIAIESTKKHAWYLQIKQWSSPYKQQLRRNNFNYSRIL